MQVEQSGAFSSKKAVKMLMFWNSKILFSSVTCISGVVGGSGEM